MRALDSDYRITPWVITPWVVDVLCIGGVVIAAAIALVDTIKRLRVRGVYLRNFLVLFIALPVIISLYRNAIGLPAKAQSKTHTSQYGVLFEKLHAASQMPAQLIVLDDGIDNTASFTHYNPELRFYAQLEQQKGIHVQVARLADANALTGLIATCDYKNTAAVRRLVAAPVVDNRVCVAGFKDQQ